MGPSIFSQTVFEKSEWFLQVVSQCWVNNPMDGKSELFWPRTQLGPFSHLVWKGGRRARECLGVPRISAREPWRVAQRFTARLSLLAVCQGCNLAFVSVDDEEGTWTGAEGTRVTSAQHLMPVTLFLAWHESRLPLFGRKIASFPDAGLIIWWVGNQRKPHLTLNLNGSQWKTREQFFLILALFIFTRKGEGSWGLVESISEWGWGKGRETVKIIVSTFAFPQAATPLLSFET